MMLEIKTIRLLMPFKMGSVNCFLINTDSGFFLIDTGGVRNRSDLERELENSGCMPGDLKFIILTHGDFDHSGNAAYLRGKYNTKIAMHYNDSDMTEFGNLFVNRKRNNYFLKKIIQILFRFGRDERFKADLFLSDGYEFNGCGFNASVVHLPGHSKGSIGILTATGDFFCGDLLEHGEKPVVGSIIDDHEANNLSLEKLKQYNINTVYPGHGKPFPMELFNINNQ